MQATLVKQELSNGSKAHVHTCVDTCVEEAIPAAYFELFVTGRLCLFGEHSDWAGEHRNTNPNVRPGRTIVVGTQEGLHAKARALDRPVLIMTTTTPDGDVVGPKELPLDAETLLQEAQSGGFWSYVAGVAYRIVVHHKVGGVEISNYVTTLPMSKGLSSSAAVCVLVVRAFNQAYDLKLTVRGEMEYAYQGEITTPSKCGRMDQACAFGPVPVVMTYDADILHVYPAPLQATLHLVLVDLRASKCTTTILHRLQSAYPHPNTDAERALHDLLGAINEQIVERALQSMKEGDLQKLGLLMCEAQQEFDARAGPMCPEQLTAPLLHKVLHFPSIQDLIYGGKGVGSQGDGTAQLLCRSEEAQQQVCELLEQDLSVHCMPLTVKPTLMGQ